MSFAIGINSPWWLVALIVLLAVAVSIWYYSKTTPPLPTLRKVLLTALRALALIAMSFVLFEPIVTFIRSLTEKPTIALLVDNSESMTIATPTSDRQKELQQAMESAGLDGLDKQLIPLSFGESVRELGNYSNDSLKTSFNFKQQRTDIERALRYVTDNSTGRNIQSVVLVSDGSFNTGANPLYEAERLGRPVYTIGIGDTIEPKDASIQSILTNDIGYIGTVIPVNITMKIAGYADGQAKVILTDNGTQIGEQFVQVRAGQELYQLTFEYKPTQDGIRRITASVQGLSNELTNKNNAVSEYITVKSNRRIVALFAGAPSPDVSFIRQIFEADKSVIVKPFIQKLGAEFYEGEQPNAQVLRDAELIVMIGYPIQSTPVTSLQLINQELSRGKPILSVASQNLDYNKLRELEEYLPFTIQTSRPNEFSITASVNESQSGNALLRIEGNSNPNSIWNQLPPIFRTETFVKAKPESEIIAGMKMGTVNLGDPLIISRSYQRSKSISILGYGLYRWKLLGNAQESAKGRNELPDMLQILVSNSAKWLNTTDDQRQVRIRTTKKQYALGEQVQIIGNIYDATMTPLDNATVTVKVNSGNVSRDVVLSNTGNGQYTTTIEGLGNGDYTYSGTVQVSNKSIGSDGGRFSIGGLAIEYQTLRMNDGLLKAIAERTGGKYYSYTQTSSLLKDITSNRYFAERTVTLTSELSLWNMAYILGFALFCFALEWFIRKRSGLI